MYGAILGDMIGRPYEWHNHKSKEFELFSDKSGFTDDSVMTVAIADGLMEAEKLCILDDEEEVKDLFIDSMHSWANRYPDAGFGGRFYKWFGLKLREPYNSYGNGSAMRVSSVGWMADDMITVRKLARWSAEVTHNHPEGIKGAESIASAIFLARTGHAKAEIKKYIEREFEYDLDRTCDEIRPDYEFDVSCQGSVPEAIISFLEGEDFVDVIRTAVSIGGDTDTVAAIAGSIAEAFYGVPEDLKEECRNRLPEDMKEVLLRFEEGEKEILIC